MNGELLAALVYAATVIAGSAAIYGILTAQSLLRLLVSIEVLFNVVVLSAAYIGVVASSSSKAGFYSVLLTVIILTIAEMAILLAIVVLIYRTRKTLAVKDLREAKG